MADGDVHPGPGAADDTCSIRVGATGTVGSLMTRELEDSAKHEKRACDPPLKHQSSPVSISCGATPKRLQRRRYPAGDSAGSSSGSSSAAAGEGEGVQELRRSRQGGRGFRLPMLTPDGSGKKGHSLFVEVVDVKCNNPMSGRLKKLGFSKLSESMA